MQADLRFMAMALTLGRQGHGRVWPNPSVGCVIVRDGRVIARARTADGGRPHAEAAALEQCEAEGATVYVTLEPCAHHGKTGPCADALIAARVARVVVAAGDPDPRVAGRGIARLRAAGIEVAVGVRSAEAEADLAGFLLKTTQNRPFTTLKLASSFDGRIAMASGESKWITSPEARRLVHAMRARHDAVLVGAGTARADDPQLTVRDIGSKHQPVRVVVSRKLAFEGRGLRQTLPTAALWICHGDDADPKITTGWAGAGARLICCARHNQQIDLVDMMGQLASAGLTRVFCEGGGSLAASLLSAGLVDEVLGFTAGLAIGAEGRPALGAMGLENLASAPRFELIETRSLGGDVMHHWRRIEA